MDLVTWLKQQIDIDEMWARDASRDGVHRHRRIPNGAHWEWVEGDDWEPVEADPVNVDFSASGLCSREQFPSEPVMTRYGIQHQMPIHYMYAEPDVVVAGHIQNWEPARVMLECRSKRLIIVECLLEMREIPLMQRTNTRAWRVLTAMALGYGERPGYQDEWVHGLPSAADLADLNDQSLVQP